MRERVIVIVGPTASGKTDAAVEIALRVGGEIISADSMQVYKEMKIGTAKPTCEEMRGVPHHLLDIVSIAHSYNVALYQKDARACIADILRRKKVPIVAGGTGLYINALVYDLDFTKQKADASYRQSLRQIPGAELHARLAEKDRHAAERIHKNDTKRIIRRLEILRAGVAESYDFRRQNTDTDFCLLGLTLDRTLLYERIGKRVDRMVACGLFDEVAALYAKFPANKTALQAIGYKEIIEHIEGRLSREQAVETIKQNTRRFAKRQYTWFNRIEGIHWFQTEKYGGVRELADAMLRAVK